MGSVVFRTIKFVTVGTSACLFSGILPIQKTRVFLTSLRLRIFYISVRNVLLSKAYSIERNAHVTISSVFIRFIVNLSTDATDLLAWTKRLES